MGVTTGGASVGGDPTGGATSGASASSEFRSAPSATEGLVGDVSLGTLEEGSRDDRGFVVADVLHTDDLGDIHFSLHVPDSYDGSSPYALYVHCPGWEGLWFQGVGAHLVEDFVFVANDYVPDMIVATPQLDDWGDTSARKTVALTRWLMGEYAIDPSRVCLSGYSAGGETISLVMTRAPELYTRVLHLSSQWDGDVEPLVAARVPVRLVVGESDDYYGSGPARDACQRLCDAYGREGVTGDGLARLVVLDVKPASYFAGQPDQHGGGAALFPHDREVMGWLFGA